MKSFNDWLIYLQTHGDDGTGHCDYQETLCDECIKAGVENND